MTDGMKDQRPIHEMQHGKMLAASDVEQVWGWKSPAGRVRARRRADLITQGAGLNRHFNVLEIGCGTGMFTEMFAGTGVQLKAIDISPDFIKRARSRNLPTNQVRFIEGRFEEYNVGGPFDAVIGSSILHHLEIERALAKIFNILKPGGILSFAEPNMLNPQVFVERKVAFVRRLLPYVSPDETAFVRWKLRHLLGQNGFEDVRIVPFDWLHPATPLSMIGFIKRLGEALEKVPVLREFSGSLYIYAKRPNNADRR